MILPSPTAPDGLVATLSSYDEKLFTPGSAVLCRNTSPLVGHAYGMTRTYKKHGQVTTVTYNKTWQSVIIDCGSYWLKHDLTNNTFREGFTTITATLLAFIG